MSGLADTTTVDINGHALRHIRVLTGPSVQRLADEVEVDRSYIARIELGRATRVSPAVYIALCQALGLEDRRILLANPRCIHCLNAVAS